MRKLLLLTAFTAVCVGLNVSSAFAQNPLASFTLGKFKFTNNNGTSAGLFNDGNPGVDYSPGNAPVFVDQTQPGHTYENFSMTLTSSASGPAQIFSDNTYRQNLTSIDWIFRDTEAGKNNNKVLLRITGTGSLTGDLGDPNTNFSATNLLQLNQVSYSSDLISEANLNAIRAYSTTFSIKANTGVMQGPGGYLAAFTGTGGGNFYASAVPEASTMVAFGMLMGSGLLGIRRSLRKKAA